MTGPSQIASPTQMEIDLNKASKLANPLILQIAEDHSAGCDFCSMSRAEIQKLVQQPVEILESHCLYQGDKLVDEGSAEKLICFVCCEDRLNRAMKASKMSALELELWEQKRGFTIMHSLFMKLDSELERSKKALKVAEEKCDMLQREKDTLLERAKKAKSRAELELHGVKRSFRILQDINVKFKSVLQDDIPSGDDRKQTTVKRPTKGKTTHRGPFIKGNDEYDKHCFFANEVEMTEDQVAYLRSQVAGLCPSIPYYVCRMLKSNVTPGKAKMYFSIKFSNGYLNRYAPMKKLPVICTDNAVLQHVKFIKGKKEDAEMTTNWAKVLEILGITEGDMCVFTFLDVPGHGFMCHVACLN